MKNESSVYKPRRSRRAEIRARKKRIFFIRRLTILTILIVLIVSCVTIIKNMIKPPSIPQPGADNLTNYDDIAFITPEVNDYDMLIGNNLDIPEGLTMEDRKDQFYTFLILGLDKGVNTDTIMVASYDGINKEANIISVPRDSLVNVKRKVKKINAAYPAGNLNGGGKEGGINQLKRELKTIIGFVPDFYIGIDLDGFERIVDAVGGIDINVSMDLKYDDPTQDLHTNIKKGQQVLNGENALKFARYRKGNNGKNTISDYERMENQQIVIKAILTKLLKPANILKIPEFIDIFNENIYSDIKTENMLWFADQLNRIKGTEALSTYTMPTTGTSGVPMYYEYLDKDGILELVNDTINPYKKDIENIHVDIIGGN
ncbi:LCP family protein [Tissierella sp. MB52-C2]|uniref:LCP family protein n=1 Tax=Tissierella sp. MB52-C2 TaxID=3070999 RepID=UPI00280A8E03|nr:LCP family protein [Tissierella sp. MB52-C2]WMM24993.1 LCP family protein [Tissierella sp. MB52-C2]